MKLIQYRFLSPSHELAKLISDRLGAFFVSIDDIDLVAICTENVEGGKVARRPISGNDVRDVIMESFIQSFSEVIDYSKYASIKSSKSCRFTMFDDDGLVRVCYSNDDIIVEFDEIDCLTEDASNLLIDTDIFDLL